jgi:hypothetical protein
MDHAVGLRRADHATPLYQQKFAVTSPTSGSHSVGIVRSRTKATGFIKMDHVDKNDGDGTFWDVISCSPAEVYQHLRVRIVE